MSGVDSIRSPPVVPARFTSDIGQEVHMDSEKPSGRTPVGEAARRLHPEAQRRIQREHENLGRLVARLESSHHLAITLSVLEELQTALVDHFTTEEADDGLHQAIGKTAPERERALEELFAEHRSFLIRLARLRRKAEACRDDLASTLEDGRRLASDLKIHEGKETELFLDAVYSEHGGGD
jgi:hypothetical protein